MLQRGLEALLSCLKTLLFASGEAGGICLLLDVLCFVLSSPQQDFDLL